MSGGGRSWVANLAVLWVAEFLALAGMSLVMPFLPLYLADLRVPPDQVRLWAGWVGGANFLAAALFAPLWGSAADRFGRKPMALRALLGLAVTVGLMGFARNVHELFALRLLQGMFGGFVAAAIALAGTFVPRERLGSALGFLQSAVVGGHLVGPLLGGELSHWFGYRGTFRITGAALLAALLLVLLFLREEHVPAEDRKGMAHSLRELARLPVLRWMLAAVFCSQAGLMLVNPQITLFVRDLVGDGPDLNRLAGLVTSAPALSSFLAAPLWGRLGDRRGHARALWLSLLGAAVLVPWTALSALFWHLFLARMALGAFTAALNPLTHSVVAHGAPEGRLAGAFSLLASAQMLGACAGPFAGGVLAAAIGVRPLFLVTAFLLLAAALAAHRAGASGR